MGPCTASSCCCQAPNLPWAPVPPPHAAARPLICHGPLYRLLMLLPGPESAWVPVRPPIAAVSIATLCHVPLSGLLTLLVCSIFCHRVLADYGPPIAAARPLICHGPLYRLLMLLPVQSPWVPVRPPIAAVSMSHAMCHFQVSSHCWCVQFFDIGC
ncbi:unnamed protein product, partial [Staurois parvus]